MEDLQGATFSVWVDAARERVRAAVAEHGRAVLFGFSLGALVALELASERRERPDEALAGLVALGNALTLEPMTSVPLGVLAFLRVPLPERVSPQASPRRPRRQGRDEDPAHLPPPSHTRRH